MDSFLSGNKFRNVINLDSLSEKDKETSDYFKLVMSIKIAQSIAINKSRQIKAYRVRYGIRDENEFRHITAKYGHDFPATLTHTPLIDRHAKVIEGQLLTAPMEFNVRSRSKEALLDANHERAVHIWKDFEGELKNTIAHNNQVINGERKEPLKDKIGESVLNNVLSKYDKNWKSSLEKESKQVLDAEIDALNIKMEMSKCITDYVTTGEAYRQDKVCNDGTRIFKRISPLEVFYIKNQNESHVSKVDCIITKKWMLIPDVILRYGARMKSDEIELLYKLYNYNSFNYYDTYIQFYSEGYLSNYDTFNDFSYNPSQYNNFSKFVLVQYVEWKSPNKVKGTNKYRQDRYSGVRIGRDIYVDCEKDIHVQRSKDDPGYCELSIDGILYDEYDNKGRSLFIDTKDLADDYDIYNFYLQNAIALSGTKVITIPTTAIPNEFGNSPTERMLEHQRYLRQGYNYINPSQAGANFSNYGAANDMSLGSGIKTIVDILSVLEERASLITGISRQAIGQITSTDGKSTTEAALNQTSLVTQKLFNTYYMFLRRTLTGVVNNAKMYYKISKRADHVLANEKDIFTISEKFFNSDYDVFLADGEQETKKIEEFKMFAMKLADQKMLDVIDGINIFSSKSLTEIKELLIEGVEKEKQNVLAQYQQKIQQLEEENKNFKKASEQLSETDLQISKEKLNLDKIKQEKEAEFKNRELDIERDYNNRKLELDRKRVELEQLQIQFSNQSMEVKNK